MKKNNEYVVALIPARAGSKGIKNKNIKKIAGKPLIEHTLLAAERAPIIDELFISTDSEIQKKTINLEHKLLKGQVNMLLTTLQRFLLLNILLELQKKFFLMIIS